MSIRPLPIAAALVAALAALPGPESTARANGQPAGVAARGPGAAPELDTLKFLIGGWQCRGRQPAHAVSGPERPITGSLRVKAATDGYWQAFDYEERRTADYPGVKLTGLWGYDQGGKRYVRTGAGNNATWETATSPGWEGSKLVWTGERSGPAGKTNFRLSFDKKGPRELAHTLEIDEAGKWTVISELTCKRAAPEEE